MRVATIRTAAGTRAARVERDELVVLDFEDVGQLLAAPDRERALHAETGDSLALADADLAPLVVRPSKIVCVGLNYRSHIEETGGRIPEHPTLFAKFTEALIGARDDIVLPRVSRSVDWEVELTAVIGEPLRHADAAAARAGIAGYTVANDVSVRDYQSRTTQFLQGKTFEGTTPVGPVLVSGDEIGDAMDLEIRCEVDGNVMQSGRTSDLIFSAVDVVAYVSDLITLRPGDLVLLGTTDGVGFTRTPPVFLAPGQVVRTAIEGIGECVNRCRAEGAA